MRLPVGKGFAAFANVLNIGVDLRRFRACLACVSGENDGKHPDRPKNLTSLTMETVSQSFLDRLNSMSANELNALIDENVKQSILSKVKETYEKAHEIWSGHNFPIPEIKFDLTGTTAGIAYHKRSGNHIIRYNFDIAKNNLEEFLNDTVIHEIGHLITDQLYYGYRLKPHSKEWYYTCSKLGLNATRCHSFSCEKSRKHLRYVGICGCGKKLTITSTIYNKIYRGQKRRCKCCGQIVNAGMFSISV